METPEVAHPPHHHTGRPVLDLVLGVSRISFVDVKPEDLSAEDYAKIDVALPKLNFLACYCSVFDECWIADSRKTEPSKVKQCPASQNAFQ